jgi:hypothetical protein
MRLAQCFLSLMLVAGLGCGHAGLPTAPVTGTVTYKSRPLSGGRIAFYHSTGRAVGADIGADGAFKLIAFQGKNRVAIECFVEPQSTRQIGGSRTFAATKSLIPVRYTEFDTSGLTFEVKAGSNQADLTLKD